MTVRSSLNYSRGHYSRAQYIDTLSWFKVVFAYRYHGSRPHTVTLSLFQIK